MRRAWLFSGRVTKEILRDPLNAFFGLGFPVVLLLLLTAIQANAPVEVFAIEQLTPGVAVFGLSFMTLFSATLISKDRTGAFFARLCTTPMRAYEYILGYTLPILPLALAQWAICYALALALGLEWSIWVVWSVLMSVPVSLFFIGLGLLCGTIFNDKQVGGICGALLTNLCAFLSGAWFDVSMVGGAFETLAKLLPFYRATELCRALLQGNTSAIFPHLWWVLAYAAATLALAILLFMRRGE